MDAWPRHWSLLVSGAAPRSWRRRPVAGSRPQIDEADPDVAGAPGRRRWLTANIVVRGWQTAKWASPPAAAAVRTWLAVVHWPT